MIIMGCSKFSYSKTAKASSQLDLQVGLNCLIKDHSKSDPTSTPLRGLLVGRSAIDHRPGGVEAQVS